jgi:hypothetical protein
LVVRTGQLGGGEERIEQPIWIAVVIGWFMEWIPAS